MYKLFEYYLTGTFITLTLFSCHANAKQLRDNYICDYNQGEITFKSSDGDWYSKTKGQPFDEKIYTVEDYPNCINVRAGRKNSAENVDWVKTKLAQQGIAWKKDYATTTDYNIDYLPAELNFAIMGTITYKRLGITAECKNVIIAQGHQMFIFVNNLWIFNNNTDEPSSIKCYDSAHQQTVYLYLSSDNYREFGGQFRFGFDNAR